MKHNHIGLLLTVSMSLLGLLSSRSRRLASAVLLICFLSSSGMGTADDIPAGDPGGARDFIKGADISFLHEITNHGGVFTEGGVQRDLLDILKDHGFDYIRLRLWHTPPDGYCGLDSTLLMASRIKAKGFGLLLNLHYSDIWADPGKQFKPGAWEGIHFEGLKDSVFEYTRYVVSRMRKAGVLPDIVQVGNEITCGMLWDDGRVCGGFDTPQQWEKLAVLISESIQGVNSALGPGDSVRIMIHIDRGADIGGSIRFYDNLLARGVGFDMIGLSYYPWWHGTLEEVESNLDTLATRYRRDIIVVETAYPWTLDWYDHTHNMVGLPDQLHPGYPATVAGQEAFLSDLIDIVVGTPEGWGRGVFYWAPEYVAVPGLGSSWENVTFFDFKGNLLPSIDGFDSPASGVTGRSSPGTQQPD